MPLTLVRRAGDDTLGKLEAAGRARFREARRLEDVEPLGAVYLYGYSIEIRLKVAYYRTIGLVPQSVINPGLHRRPAENAINRLPQLPRHPSGGPSAGHHLVGWARLLEQERATQPGRTPMPPALATAMHAHVDTAFSCWVESLRYRANKPTVIELDAVRYAARWFRANSNGLWR